MHLPYFDFFHLSVEGHFGCVHLLAIINNAIMCIGVHGFVRKYVLSSLGFGPRSYGIARSYSDFV